MDGDIAPMDKIVKLANQYGAMTYVDDAHGEGVIGPDGRGIGAHFHIEGKIDVKWERLVKPSVLSEVLLQEVRIFIILH